MTEYFAIRSDDHYSQFADSNAVAAFLNAMPELRSSDGSTWASSSDDWFTLSLVVANTNGGYASNGQLPLSFNCITIASSESRHDSIHPILMRIASHVGWDLVDDGPV